MVGKQKITSVTGFEPRREGEFPLEYRVGSRIIIAGQPREISRIACVDGRFCEWFDIYTNGTRIASLSEHAIALITYKFD